jgi:hypothetical protein
LVIEALQFQEVSVRLVLKGGKGINEDFPYKYAVNTLFGQNAKVYYVKEGGTHCDQRALKA